MNEKSKNKVKIPNNETHTLEIGCADFSQNEMNFPGQTNHPTII